MLSHSPAPPSPPPTPARAEDSAGELGVIEVGAGPDFPGPPLHHHDFDETFYILDGELTFQLGDALRTAGPGEVVFAPRGAHHALANLSGAPARYLIICNPGGVERRVAPPPPGGGAPPQPGAPGPVLGPPLRRARG